MVSDISRWRYRGLLTLWIALAFGLFARLGYLYLADMSHYPINTVKISANFQRISRQQLEAVLSNYQQYSFFSLPASRLRKDLESLDWADEVTVRRIWPDVLNIKLVEKQPVARWNQSLITIDGRLFNIGQSDEAFGLAKLTGPDSQKNDVLQIYQKLSKLLSSAGLSVALLQLHENQSWDLSLTNGIDLHLGKQDLEKRLQRFCKAYQATLATKLEQLVSVDLRYERGMAVQWRQQTGR
jgi:cell division protein FtsQ